MASLTTRQIPPTPHPKPSRVHERDLSEKERRRGCALISSPAFHRERPHESGDRRRFPPRSSFRLRSQVLKLAADSRDLYSIILIFSILPVIYVSYLRSYMLKFFAFCLDSCIVNKGEKFVHALGTWECLEGVQIGSGKF
jgi:hypothetical protein